MQNSILLISIKPKYVEMIFNGIKTIELRRKYPKAKNGTIVVIYASSPTKAIIGIGVVDEVVSDHPQSLWRSVRHNAGVTLQEFKNYFEDSSTGVGIHLKEINRLTRPLNLSQLREVWPKFHPPQGYHYLSQDSYAALISAS